MSTDPTERPDDEPFDIAEHLTEWLAEHDRRERERRRRPPTAAEICDDVFGPAADRGGRRDER